MQSRFRGGAPRNGTQGSPNPAEQGLVQDGAPGWQRVGEKAAPRPGRDTMEHRLLKASFSIISMWLPWEKEGRKD